MSEGPYRVEWDEEDITYAGRVVDTRTHPRLAGPTPGVGLITTMGDGSALQKEAGALNSAFAAGAESNAKYKAAWDELMEYVQMSGPHDLLRADMVGMILRVRLRHGLEVRDVTHNGIKR